MRASISWTPPVPVDGVNVCVSIQRRTDCTSSGNVVGASSMAQ